MLGLSVFASRRAYVVESRQASLSSTLAVTMADGKADGKADEADLLGLEDDAGPQEPAPEAAAPAPPVAAGDDLLGSLDPTPSTTVEDPALQQEPAPTEQQPEPLPEPEPEPDQPQEEVIHQQEPTLTDLPAPTELPTTDDDNIPAPAAQETAPPPPPPPAPQEEDQPIEDPLTAAMREQQEAERRPSPAPVLTQSGDPASPPAPAPAAAHAAHASPTRSGGGGSFQDQQTVRRYLDNTIVPVLRMGMRELCIKRPADPFQFLADYLIQNKPR